ncbi:MAG: hypothetical protein JWR26_2850 [Pedosphaera sp.]|nr:hypothetical protein [Pedosphaera sp.]
MMLSAHPLSVSWLTQFNTREIHCARLLLDTLKLVSHADFENSLSSTIQAICNETTGRIALFSLDERIIESNSKPGSAGRLAHTLTNLSRLHPERILVHPSKAEMRSHLVKHIVLVEDFVGSGKRVKDFWNAWASKTIKSWLSYHVCQIWLAGYAIHDDGMAAACDRITYLQPDRIRFEVRLVSAKRYWPEVILEFLERSANRTDLRIYPRGFGHIAAPIVFQHGCPDNSPVILWKGGKTFRPLFPDRGIPIALSECFHRAEDLGRAPELLWHSGQHRLALSLILEINGKKRSEEYLLLLTALGLLLRGVIPANLAQVMTAEATRIERLLERARELGLVGSDGFVTLFGRDVVDRSRRSFLTAPEVSPPNDSRGLGYVPKQFRKQSCGVQ